MKTIISYPAMPLVKWYATLIAIIFLVAIYPHRISAQWNTNTYVNLGISSLSIADMHSVSTSDGKMWIAFYHENADIFELWAQLLDSDGSKLLGEDGILVDNTLWGPELYDFNICTDVGNNLVIAGQSNPGEEGLYVWVSKISQDGSQLWGAFIGYGHSPYICSIYSSEIAITWFNIYTNTLSLATIASDGTENEGEEWFGPVTVNGSNTTRGQIVENRTGEFTLIFQVPGEGNLSTLYAQSWSAIETGFHQAMYPPLQITNQATSSDQYYSVVADNDTTYVGYHTLSGGRFNSYLQRINFNGALPWGINGSNFSTAVASGDNNQGQTRISFLPGTDENSPGSDYIWSVCTYSNPGETSYGVYIQKFLKATGARLFTDGAKVVYPVSTNNDHQAGDLSLIDDTPVFISYDDNYKIYATRLDSSGNFVWTGNRVELGSTTASDDTPKMQFFFSKMGDNRFTGIWSENRDTTYKGYAQCITSDGLIGLEINTQDNVPPLISTVGGSLQMVGMIIPSTAIQDMTWSVVPGSGMAIISATGLLTAVSNGTVWAKATALQDLSVKDSLLVTISGQPLPPGVITLPASNIQSVTATLNGSVIAYNSNTQVTFEWGLTPSYGNAIDAIPSTVTGESTTAVLADLTGLTIYTTYHFRCIGVNAIGATSYGADQSFTTGCTTDAAGEITGPVNVCYLESGVVYSIPPISNATGYAWTVPPGASIISGENTPVITVDFATNSGNVTVHGTTSCGTGLPSSIGVSVTPHPVPTITGNADICFLADETYYYMTEPGMTAYEWTISPGGTIISGNETNSVLVDWDTTGNQSVSVTYTSLAGCIAASPATLEVSVIPIPPAPAITQDGWVLTSSASAGNQWYFADETDGPFAMVPGATGQDYIVESTGYYYDIVTLNGCQSSPSDTIYVLVTGIPDISGSQIIVYPLPNNGLFSIAVKSPSKEDVYSISVMNNLGVKLYNARNVKLTASDSHFIDLRPVGEGVYTLLLETKTEKLMKKFLVGR